MIRVDDPQLPFVSYECETEEEWLAFRNEGVGGSDVSSIMGINAYSSPFEVWCQKTGRTEPKDLSDKESVEWGNILEPVIRQEFAKRHPEFDVLGNTPTLVSRERPWAHANLDGVIVDGETRGILEIKTVGANRSSDWKNGVPDYYLTQVTHYMSVTGWKFAYVAALIGGQSYVEFRVDRDDGDIAMVNDAVDTFWKDFVVADVPPTLVGTDGESKAMFEVYGGGDGYVTPENMAHFDALVEEYRDAKACEKVSKERAARAANNIKAAIGSNKGATSDLFRVTWTTRVNSSFDTKRFRAEHPDLASEYTTTSVVDSGIRISEVRQ